MVIKFEEVEEVVEENNNVDIHKEFIREFINNEKKYMTFDEILSIQSTKMNTSISTILQKYLSENITICENKIYLYNSEIAIHHKMSNIDIEDFFSVYIITFVETSIIKLQKSQREIVERTYNTKYIQKNVLKILITNLTVKKETFEDPKLCQIHFKNGYIDMKTQKFKKRRKTDYMTYCIWREFKTAPKHKRETMENIFNQVYPNKDDKNCVFESFAEGISGTSNQSQYNLFLTGIGSSGKSTIMNISKIAFQQMIFQFKEDTFSVTNTKVDRILNMLMYNPFIRLMWVNELKGKIDDSLFKQICEGQVQTTSLFQEGQNVIKFNALLVITSNDFPNIKIDTGVVRRIKSLEHQSLFTTDKSKVDEENNVYHANTKLLEMIENDEELQNAFVEMICEYGYDLLNGKRYELSKNFKETKANIVGTNDSVKEFMDLHIEITDNENDKLGINEIHDSFKILHPKSNITKQQLIGKIKDLTRIQYNPNLRFGDHRGGFLKLKFKEDTDDNKSSSCINNNKQLDYYDFGAKELNNEMKLQLDKLSKDFDEYKNTYNKSQFEWFQSQIKKLTEELETYKSNNNKSNQIVETKKKVFSLEELELKVKHNSSREQTPNKNKVKVNKSITTPKPEIKIEDIDDGYTTDDLELQFKKVVIK